MRLTTASRLSAFWIGPNWAAATLTTRMDSFLRIFMATLHKNEAACGQAEFGVISCSISS
jgi:hypothetical protein